ncbi:hypothetical protein CA983_35035 [Streptomyces swartbergensis]|uniref:Tetratricopeptide repeat protein n=1 Tax=Streptomyces swartbergensis TaxID=487165 RepID=A0A243RI09_9ACTN|nr:hypothetical protein [Streptomyces swartbergensis]OUC94483.1 hypothetical protein CA983_35035 [Streptomyces swartbergensis]
MVSGLTVDDAAVAGWLAMSGRAAEGLRELAKRRPECGVARALSVLADNEVLDDATLRRELVAAYALAQAAGAREQSLVYGIYLFTHRHYQATADHLVVHFAQWPADEVAGSMLGAFDLAGPLDYREHGQALIEKQWRRVGAQSWPWTSWLAAARAEQGRSDEAWELAEHALKLNARSGPAAHARAHAEHEHGAGLKGRAFIDAWLAADPAALQRRHLQWHAALQSIAAGDFDDARRRADTELHHGDVGMRSATNWRLLLAGQAPARTTELQHAHRLLAEPGGWAEVFHTFQLALALAVGADTDGLTALAERAESDTRPDYAEVLAPVAHALAHLTAGRPGKAVDLLTVLGEETERIGGVRVEREIIKDTLARALIDAGQPQRAAHLLHHRRTTRHHHTYEDLLLTPAPTTQHTGAVMTPAS